MCGIAGIVLSRKFDCSELNRLIGAMTNTLEHRGPDGVGVWIKPSEGLAFGHRRLSVIDLSSSGDQPMVSRCGRFRIVMNGEIYNFLELRDRLERARSICWRGHSDTEVLLEGISKLGLEKMLGLCDGMFALALYDQESKKVHLARDRFGEKPLYYAWIDGSLIFGSELNALRAYPGFDQRIDRSVLAGYFSRGFVLSDACIYEGVKKLPPGAVLTIDLGAMSKAHQEAPAQYWSAVSTMRSARARPFGGSLPEAVDQLDSLLSLSVRRRMISDVPFGAFLSGGIDSSTIVALMQAERTDQIRTFSIGNRSAGYDESTFAARVAHHLGTDHTELTITAADALSVIPSLPSIYDEPFGDSSQIPTYLVASLARKHVTVALSGDAGDELFGGYNRYIYGERIWSRLSWFPLSVRRSLEKVLTWPSPQSIDRWVTWLGAIMPEELAFERSGDKLHKLAGFLGAVDQQDFHQRILSCWPERGKLVLGASPASGDSDMLGEDQLKLIERWMAHDVLEYLPDDILTKVDRASMAVGLEVRVPMLDWRVFEFAWKLPLEFKVAAGQGKRVLREVLYRYVPREFFERPKQGFAVPIGSWLRHELRDWAEALLDPVRLHNEGYLDVEVVRNSWDEHLRGKANWDRRLWSVLMFQAWQEGQSV